MQAHNWLSKKPIIVFYLQQTCNSVFTVSVGQLVCHLRRWTVPYNSIGYIIFNKYRGLTADRKAYARSSLTT